MDTRNFPALKYLKSRGLETSLRGCLIYKFYSISVIEEDSNLSSFLILLSLVFKIILFNNKFPL